MTNILKMRCPRCRRLTGVNQDGLFRRHRTRQGNTCPMSSEPAS